MGDFRRATGRCLALVALALAGGCGEQTPEQKARSQRESQAFDDEVEVSRIAKDAVRNCLKWPHDASFDSAPSGTNWSLTRNLNTTQNRAASLIRRIRRSNTPVIGSTSPMIQNTSIISRF